MICNFAHNSLISKIVFYCSERISLMIVFTCMMKDATNVCVCSVEAVTAICEVSQRIQNNTRCHENHLQLCRVQKLLKGRKTKVLAAGRNLWSHIPMISSKNHLHLLSTSFCIYCCMSFGTHSGGSKRGTDKLKGDQLSMETFSRYSLGLLLINGIQWTFCRKLKCFAYYTEHTILIEQFC